MLEIVIPVFNEEKILKEKEDYYRALQQRARLIFVDGGSTDETVPLASRYGRVVFFKKGRASQKKRGAREVTSDCLLFLNVDSYIDFKSINEIKGALNNGSIAGCFTMKIEDDKKIFRLFEKLINWRARKFGVVDADLGLFVKGHVFERLGGFDELPLMDDILFARKLRKQGKITVLPFMIKVSARKWYEQGFFKTFLNYFWAYVQLWSGILSLRVKEDEN